jgi:hypothetical protein
MQRKPWTLIAAMLVVTVLMAANATVRAVDCSWPRCGSGETTDTYIDEETGCAVRVCSQGRAVSECASEPTETWGDTYAQTRCFPSEPD